MRDNPRPQEIYRHFKGNLYQILSLAEHSETGEILVVYQALYGEFKVYARELSMFLSKTDLTKYPDATQFNRFEKVTVCEAECAPAQENVATQENVAEADEQANNTADLSTDAEQEELCALDPLVLEFLDADSYEQRLNILTALHARITDDMINTMAISVDVEINEGAIEERYEALKNCLLTLEKYECNRMR